VVEATKQALAATLKSLQALSPEPADFESDARVEEEVAAAVADATASVDGTDGGAPGAATLASVDGVAMRSLSESMQRVDALLGSDSAAASSDAAPGDAPRAPPAPSPAAVAAAAKAAADAKQRNRWVVVGLVAAVAFAASAFIKSPLGASAVAALQSLAQPLLDKLGPIHVGDAERGLLETIYLLLTSIVCVPAVCKLIPGGSPVLGYLVSGPSVCGSLCGGAGRPETHRRRGACWLQSVDGNGHVTGAGGQGQMLPDFCRALLGWLVPLVVLPTRRCRCRA
jgi:hypothetical protein